MVDDVTRAVFQMPMNGSVRAVLLDLRDLPGVVAAGDRNESSDEAFSLPHCVSTGAVESFPEDSGLVSQALPLREEVAGYGALEVAHRCPLSRLAASSSKAVAVWAPWMQLAGQRQARRQFKQTRWTHPQG